MNNNGQRVIGALPNGTVVYASEMLIAQLGIDRVRWELVDREFARCGMDPPGYYRVRTRPFFDDYVLVKADSHDAAVNKYLAEKKKTSALKEP